MIEEAIMKKLEAIERNSLLAAKNVFTVDEASFFTGLSKGTIHHLTYNRKIPCYKRGKYLYFDRAELEEWMKARQAETPAGSETPGDQ